MGAEVCIERPEAWIDGLRRTGLSAEKRGDEIVLTATDGGSQAYALLSREQARQLAMWLIEQAKGL